MCGFISSSLANFLGSLLAGGLLAWIAYVFITRKYQIIQPRRERIKEEILVCSLLIDELVDGREFADSYLGPGPRSKKRLQMHAWDALKGSQAVRFLPIGCLKPMLKAYGDLNVLEYMFLKVESAQLRDWETGNSGVASGAARLGKMISEEVKIRLARLRENCADAVSALTVERERLNSDLGSGA